MSQTVAPATSFAELSLLPTTRAALASMQITEPTPIQSQAIPGLLEGRDLIGQARTGSGKTLAFAIPIVERCDPALRAVQALVLVPTRELAVQVGDVLRELAGPRKLKVALLYGGRGLGGERQALVAGAQVVVGAPGRTLDHLRQGSLSLKSLKILVLDEGDEMLDRGFAPDVERIIGFTPAGRQTALFSATLPEWIMQTVHKHLRQPLSASVDQETETPTEIEHVVYEVDPSVKLGALRTLLDQRSRDGATIVFGRTKHGVKKLAQKLNTMGYPVAALQGNLSQNARERVMADFRAGDVPILLATNVAARGLDVDQVERVINYELPESAQLFTHRVGRTGRMGRQGEAITLITPEDEAKWRQIEKQLGRRLPRRPWTADPAQVITPEDAAFRPEQDDRPPRQFAMKTRTRPLGQRMAQANRPAGARPAGSAAAQPSRGGSRPIAAPASGAIPAPGPRTGIGSSTGTRPGGERPDAMRGAPARRRRVRRWSRPERSFSAN